MIILLSILIFLNVAQIFMMFVCARLLVNMQESDLSRIKRFLENRGLIDLPMASGPQRDYTSNIPTQVSSDLKFIRDD